MKSCTPVLKRLKAPMKPSLRRHLRVSEFADLFQIQKSQIIHHPKGFQVAVEWLEHRLPGPWAGCVRSCCTIWFGTTCANPTTILPVDCNIYGRRNSDHCTKNNEKHIETTKTFSGDSCNFIAGTTSVSLRNRKL